MPESRFERSVSVNPTGVVRKVARLERPAMAVVVPRERQMVRTIPDPSVKISTWKLLGRPLLGEPRADAPRARHSRSRSGSRISRLRGATPWQAGLPTFDFPYFRTSQISHTWLGARSAASKRSVSARNTACTPWSFFLWVLVTEARRVARSALRVRLEARSPDLEA